MSANPHANGGLLLKGAAPAGFSAATPLQVTTPGAVSGEATRVQGRFIRDVVRDNPDNFRVFSPDETASNRWTPCSR